MPDAGGFDPGRRRAPPKNVLGDYITEINVTCPTGIQEISRLNDDNLAAKVWDAIEAKVAARAERRPV